MSLDACAGIVQRGDPERFQSLMSVPVAARATLLPLYAFNLEIARLPWVSKEPMIAEMRLQWWRDILSETTPRAHEVAGPLHDLIRSKDLPIAVFEQMIAARSWDIYTDPFVDQEAFDSYIDQSAGGLMWLGALALGADHAVEAKIRDYAYAAGLANYLRAVPELVERNRIPLLDGRDEGLRALAARGLMRLNRARRTVGDVKPARAAMLAGWQAEALLRQVLREPQRVGDGSMGLSEFQKRGRLLWQGLTGQF